MRKSSTALAAMVFSLSMASAQARPDFAGKWLFEVERTKAANLTAGAWAEGVSLASAFTLSLSGNLLTRVTEGKAGSTTVSYKLDDSEQTVTTPQGEAKARAKREGAKIVIVTVRQTANGPVRSVSEYSVDGDTLVVTTTAPPPGGGNPVTNTLYYRRAS